MSYLDSLIRSESGGNWRAQNSEIGAGGKAGHFGRVQFGYARLQDAMNAGAIPQGTTPEMFMASPELQMAAEKWHFADLEKNLAPLVGSVVNGQTLDLGALVAMGHLGGAGGARKYVQTGGKYNPSDSFGTSLADYAGTHGGGLLNVSTSGPTTDGTDTMDKPGGLLGKFQRTEDNVGGLLGMLFKNMSPDRADSIRAALGSLPGIDNQGAVGAATMRMQGRREAESEDLRYARALEERQRQEALAAQEKQAAMAAEERQRAVARDWIARNAPAQLEAFDAGIITPAQVYEAANPDQPAPTDDMREYAAAKAEGYTGSLEDWLGAKDGKDGRYQAVGGQIWDMTPDGGGPPQLVGGGTEEVIYGPDGNPIVTRGPAGSTKPFTESQSKDVVYATRAKGALSTLDPLAGALTDRGDVAAGWLPMGLGGGYQSDDYQVAKTAGDEFLQAILRKDTGAAITADEQVLYGETYLPKPGDNAERLKYKAEARQRAVAAIEAGMSPAQIIAKEKALQAGSPAAPPPANAPTGGVATINNDAEYDALPSGAEFVGPDGVKRRKP